MQFELKQSGVPLRGCMFVSDVLPAELSTGVCVDRTMAEDHHICRQRSWSLTRPLSRSADWTEELERRLRSREDGGGSGGSGEYLLGYRGGSQPLCATRRSSCGQGSACGFQDVFTGLCRASSAHAVIPSHRTFSETKGSVSQVAFPCFLHGWRGQKERTPSFRLTAEARSLDSPARHTETY